MPIILLIYGLAGLMLVAQPIMIVIGILTIVMIVIGLFLYKKGDPPDA